MIKGIIFDLDGVLVSTDEMHYLAWKRLADELQITGFTREDNRRQRGVSRMASLEIVLEKADRVYTEEEKAEKRVSSWWISVSILGGVILAAVGTILFIQKKKHRDGIYL